MSKSYGSSCAEDTDGNPKGRDVFFLNTHTRTHFKYHCFLVTNVSKNDSFFSYSRHSIDYTIDLTVNIILLF